MLLQILPISQVKPLALGDMSDQVVSRPKLADELPSSQDFRHSEIEKCKSEKRLTLF